MMFFLGSVSRTGLEVAGLARCAEFVLWMEKVVVEWWLLKKIWNAQNLDNKLEKDFLAEVQILGEIRHTNIVKLLCCISSSEAKLLVYEYMENGSLDRWLHQRDRVGSLAPLD